MNRTPVPSLTVKITRQRLFQDWAENGLGEGFDLIGILDGYWQPGLAGILSENGLESLCLWRGRLGYEKAERAPYLVRLNSHPVWFEALLEKSWGKPWGIFAAVPKNLSLDDLRRHWRELLQVRLPSQEIVNFRFYDPRVMEVYLPTCNPHELKTIFGPVLGYVLQGEENADWLFYTRQDDELRLQRWVAPLDLESSQL